MIHLDKLCQKTINVIKQTAEYIENESHKLKSIKLEFKSNNEIVTKVDRTAEKMIVAGLQALIPEAGFLTEEKTIEKYEEEYNWIIDPLDGTTNFVYQIPFYCISVALKKGDETILGIVYDIVHKECFYAWKGGGAFVGGEKIAVSENPDLSSAFVSTGLPNEGFEFMPDYIRTLKAVMDNVRGIRRLGSAALELCYVASGRFDAFFEFGLKPWDIEAGLLILEEAGGSHRLRDSKIGINKPSELIAANKNVFNSFNKLVVENYYNIPSIMEA